MTTDLRRQIFSRGSLIIEDHTNWSLSRILEVRDWLADSSSVLSGVAVLQLPTVHQNPDQFTVIVHYMIAPSNAPNLQQYCVELPLERGVNLMHSKIVRDS